MHLICWLRYSGPDFDHIWRVDVRCIWPVSCSYSSLHPFGGWSAQWVGTPFKSLGLYWDQGKSQWCKYCCSNPSCNWSVWYPWQGEPMAASNMLILSYDAYSLDGEHQTTQRPMTEPCESYSAFWGLYCPPRIPSGVLVDSTEFSDSTRTFFEGYALPNWMSESESSLSPVRAQSERTTWTRTGLGIIPRTFS
jgi:hypothetical protein